MINIVIDSIKKNKMLEKGDNVTVALSGGADSVCLLICLLELRENFGITVEAVHINHNIRGSESYRDEDFCRKLCEKLGVSLKICSEDIPKLAETSGKSVEETARDVRYKRFSEISGKIATAHTLSDNAETVLLNLIRGTGLKGLCGIPAVRGNIIRPLISVTREQVESYLKEKNQGYVTDSTNLSDDYTRNKIRHKIIPIILDINKGFYKSFSNSINVLCEENDFIENITDEYYKKNYCEGRLFADPEKPEVIKKRGIARFLNENELPVSFDKINQISSLPDKNGTVNIAKDTFIKSKNGNIFIEKKQPEIIKMEIPLKTGENQIFENKILLVEKTNINNKDKNLIDLDKVLGKIILRNRRHGDKIKLAGREFTSAVKKLLNEKVSVEERSFIHFLQDDKGLIFMENFGVADRVKVDDDSENIIKISIK